MGTLKKKGMQAGLFKNKLYKRFFIANNDSRKILIYKDQMQTGVPIEFNFSDLLRVNEGESTKSKRQKWGYQINIIMIQREYVLFAPTIQEQQRWLHTFKWILELNMFN